MASEIIELKLTPSPFCKPESKIEEQQFFNLLTKAIAISPDDELLSNWQYAPWYDVELKTKKGEYHVNLYLGGLGIVTLPNKKRGAIRFFDLST